MKRFPTRTLVLMVLALLAFVWMYLQTHKPAASANVPVEIVSPPLPAASDARE